MNKLYSIFFLLSLGCCCHMKGSRKDISMCPIPVAPVEAENDMTSKFLSNRVNYPLGIIGEVENVYLRDMVSGFPARIDTGAETSSMDAMNVKEFERDGESWVSFDVENRTTKEKVNFEKKVSRKTNIKRQQGGDENRITVKMEIKIGDQLLTKEFTLANREKFDYQILIGRNVLNGLAVVDVGIKNSLN